MLFRSFSVQAMAGIAVGGDLEAVVEAITAMEEVDYTVVVAGRFDVIVEIVAEDVEHLITIVGRIRDLPTVSGVELFTYLRLTKQTYNWGTR